MKLEASSKNLLAVTKAKAKMYEFGIDEAYHQTLVQTPRNLLITTIGILGDLSALEAGSYSVTDTHYISLKEQLISVSQYFDALNQTHIADEYSLYLTILGASAYYLADMPGSSLVLAKSLPYQPDQLTPNYLEGALIWLLKSDIGVMWYRFEDTPITEDIDHFCQSFNNYFSQSISSSDFSSISQALRNKIYFYGNDRELFFIDIICAIAKRKIANSSINLLPKYTNLPIIDWTPALNKPSFINEFWPAQRLLGAKGVLSGSSAVVQMPTSAGKTKSTELIIRSAFLSGRAKLAVVIAPFRALCREITSTFENVFSGEDIKINELQDITQISEAEDDFIRLLLSGTPWEKKPQKTIIVSTPEKLIYLLRHEPRLASEIGLLIFDEGHQFDTGTRGVTYELLIASLKEKVDLQAQKVLISAVMANAKSIGDWLNGNSSVDIQGNQTLPTIRSVAFVSWTKTLGQLHYIDQDRIVDRDYYVPRVIEQINLGKVGAERKDRLFPQKNDSSSMAAYLGVKLCHKGPVAIFCGLKISIITISKLLVEYYERGLELPSPNMSSDQSELDKIAYLSSLHFGEEYIISKAIKLGVLPHSGNIPNGIRCSVEWVMEHNKACLVVCTSTLAQGVNLPIKYLIVSSTLQAGNEISTRDFHNLIGRAGRAGYHTEGSIIFADSKIYDFRHHYYKKDKWKRALHLLDFLNAEECFSSLKSLISPFEFDLIETDIINFISDPKSYRQQCLALSEEHGIDIASLLAQMEYKERLIRSIESYFLSHLKDSAEIEQSFFVDLASGTLAYHLADEEEKELLVSAFEVISKKVLKLDHSKFSYYGKTLLGIDQILIIEEWLTNNFNDLISSDSIEELLRICWSLILLLNSNSKMSKVRPQEILQEFAQKWIAGLSYSDLYSFFKDHQAYYEAKSKTPKISIEYTIELIDGALSYDAMLHIGALADVLEGQGINAEIIENVRTLQIRLKLGLASNLELWLYSKGFVDREVCKSVAKVLSENGVSKDDFNLNILEEYHNVIDITLSRFPSYFSSN